MDEFDSCDGVEFMDGSGDSDNTASMSTAATSINLGFLDDHEGIVAASDTEMLTTEWVPGSAGVDVSGSQPLCCAAFLDFTQEAPNAHLPSVFQLPFVLIEEPEIDATVTTSSASVGGSQPAAGHAARIWYITQARDVSGAVSVGVPQRQALQLAAASSVEGFCERKAQGTLNTPLFCHIRGSRKPRTSAASQSQDSESGARVFVNHTIEALEAVTWGKEAVPNKSYEQVIALLNICPRHDEG